MVCGAARYSYAEFGERSERLAAGLLSGVPLARAIVMPLNVRLTAGHELTEDQLCAFLQDRIAKFKMPRRFHFMDAPLPKTGTGKIVKRALREIIRNG